MGRGGAELIWLRQSNLCTLKQNLYAIFTVTLVFKYVLHCPKSNQNFREITWNVEEKEILHEIFRAVSRFPRSISCYIAENQLHLGQGTPLSKCPKHTEDYAYFLSFFPCLNVHIVYSPLNRTIIEKLTTPCDTLSNSIFPAKWRIMHNPLEYCWIPHSWCHNTSCNPSPYPLPPHPAPPPASVSGPPSWPERLSRVV